MYTKGEWTFSKMTNKGTQNFDKVFFTIFSNEDDFKRDVIADTPYAKNKSVEEHQANARLISAAPDLLEACENLVTDMQQNLTKQERLERIKFAQQVINKAKGE